MNSIPPEWADRLFLANQVFFAIIFVIVAARAVRERRRASVDVALLFGAMAFLLILTRVADALGVPAETSRVMVIPLILAVPYLMFRLVADFASVPRWVLRVAEIVFASEIVALIGSGSLPLAAAAAYTAVAIAWSSVAFVREARRSHGVAGRRYAAIAVGNAAAVTSLVVVLITVPPGGDAVAPAAAVLLQLCVFVVGGSYLVGFATPLWLRRLWRDADLRSFLTHAPALIALPETDALVRELALQARDAMGFDGALIGLPAGPGRLRFQGTGAAYEAPTEQTFSGRAMAAGHAIVSFDPVRDVPARADLYRERNAKVLVAAPLRSGDEVIGGLAVRSSHASLFAGDDLEMCQLLADQAAVILKNRGLIEERERQAERDALTGLPNAGVLSRRVEECIGTTGTRGPCALLLMDLDAFAEVDQTFGHDVGDDLLVQIARRLSGIAPEGSLLARWTGDRFALLLPGQGLATAELVATEILASFEQPYAAAGEEIECGASIGVAVHPDHAADARGLIAAADIALGLATRTANTYAVYPLDAHPQQARRLALRADLRRAIADGSIRLEYQPLVSLRSGALLRLEALARWEDPRRGSVPPLEFVDLAERTGLIRPLTEGVLRQALADAREWRRWLPRLQVAINLSARMLADAGLIERIEAACSATGCEPDALSLEITESVLMTEPERAREMVTRLREIGITTAIDDFGTGYSSLAYLQRLPVTSLKIDHQFTFAMSTDERSDAIVRATIRLAHELGFEVVAEGIADRRLWDLLAASGCDVGQGFYIARPMRGELIRKWLGTWMVRTPATPAPPPRLVERRRRLVLVVDDDPAIVSVVGDVLREHGYSVATASNGEEALDIVTSAKPDAVLLDMHMPVLDGSAFAQALRDRGIHTPLVVMTAGANAEMWAKRLGASGHLPKPFAVDQLLSVTGQAVEDRPAPLH